MSSDQPGYGIAVWGVRVTFGSQKFSVFGRQRKIYSGSHSVMPKNSAGAW